MLLLSLSIWITPGALSVHLNVLSSFVVTALGEVIAFAAFQALCTICWTILAWLVGSCTAAVMTPLVDLFTLIFSVLSFRYGVS